MAKDTAITVVYEAVDGVQARRRFYTLKLAQAYAQERVGETPELGAFYAVSFDGVGKIMVDGVDVADLFPALKAEREYADWDAKRDRPQIEVFADGSDSYTGEDDLTEYYIELRNDEYASRQTAIDAYYGM
jgi:hypothetical protein